MEKLRNVVFTLNQIDGTIGDFVSSGVDPDEVMQEREGLFHQWGAELVYCSKTETLMSRTIGIVEEKNSGKVYHVIPKCITFNN